MLKRKNQNTELAAALAALRAEFNDHEVANEYGFSDLEGRLENLDELVDRYAGLPSDVEDTDYRVNDIESRVDDVESRIDQLEIDLSSANTVIAELEEQIDAQANIIRDLHFSVADLLVRIAKLEVK